MAVIMVTETIAANTVNDNILQGSQFEFIRGRSIVSMGITAEDASDVFVTISAGPNIIAEEFNPPQATDYANTDEGFYFNAGVIENDRLSIRVRNADAANPEVVRAVVQITEV